MNMCLMCSNSYPEGLEEKRNPAANTHTDSGHPHNVSALCPRLGIVLLLPAHPAAPTACSPLALLTLLRSGALSPPVLLLLTIGLFL